MTGEVIRITPEMAEYPELLRQIKGFPKELFCIGDISLLNERCVAIVGSRRTTGYGRSTAVNMAKKIADVGLAVVSGMAMGIDTCAHRGALDSGGKTIAVLGCGVNVCYPKSNLKLRDEIISKGLIVSEYPPNTSPQKYFFPRRNRIISGLSEITVVVQAGTSSGALITAEIAVEQGREVCAVPGNIDSPYNMGNNKLIKDGAVPILSYNDVPILMGKNIMDEREAEALLSISEKQVYDILRKQGEITVDQLCRIMSKPSSYVSAIVTVMEMKGVIFYDLGKIFIAKG